MSWRWLAAAAVLVGAGAAAWWGLRPKAAEVLVVRVQRVDFTDTVPGTAAGVVEPARRLRVAPELAARILEVKVRRGDRVKAGDALVVLDDADVRDQVRALEAALPVLQARVRQAQARAGQVGRDADRAVRLAKDGSLPTAQADTASSGRTLADLDVTAAGAALNQARVQLDVARGALRKAVLRAPFDGIVLDVDAEVGQMASPLSLGTGNGAGGRSAGGLSAGGSTAALLAAGTGGGTSGLVDLADESELAVEVDLDERDYGRVKVGQEAVLAVDALGKKAFAGTVAEVWPYVSRALDQNRTARIRVRLPDAARAEVRPGMSVQVEVKVDRREGVLAVPTPAVSTRRGIKVAWRVDDDRVREAPLVVSAATWEWTVLASGLAEGDRVVLPRGDLALADGLRVRPREEAIP